jgi:hypothetical protein
MEHHWKEPAHYVEEDSEIQNSPNPFYPGFLLCFASPQPE